MNTHNTSVLGKDCGFTQTLSLKVVCGMLFAKPAEIYARFSMKTKEFKYQMHCINHVFVIERYYEFNELNFLIN